MCLPNRTDTASQTTDKPRLTDLLLSVINVSVQTVDIVNALPKIDFGSSSNEIMEENVYPSEEDNLGFKIAADPRIDL